MYKIGELSRLSNLPVKTLRYYDSEGILRPDYIDDFTGYRYYSASKLSDCYSIIALKELGFSLNEIKEYFSMPKERVLELIEAKEQELYHLKKLAEDRIHILRNLNSALKENESMFDIVIRKSEKIRLAYCRDIISDKSEAGSLLKEMQRSLPGEILGSRTVVIDYETEFVTENFDTGFGVEITGKLPKSCGLSEKTLCFTSDTANLVCTEEESEDAMRALHKYVLDHNYQIIGPTYKVMYQDNTIEMKLPVVKLGEFDANYSEDLDLPFVNDEEVVGHWEIFDYLPCREMFHPGKPKAVISTEHVKELYFLPGGERYWCFGWTKGLLLSTCGYPKRTSRNRYTIENIGDDTFLFVEFKGSSYFEGGKPELWVFRKTDSNAYSKRDIMMVDEIPDVPADDKRVLGTWNVCDLVKSLDDFDLNHTCTLIPYEGLCWRRAEFLPEGTMRNSFLNSQSGSISTDDSGIWRWVTEYVICSPRKTASRYVIRKYNEEEYLFIQWKSGDYSFGGEEPSWYVFKR